MNDYSNTAHLAVEEMDNIADIDYHIIKKAALVLRSLNHKLRQQMLMILNENRLTVTQLYVKLRLEQSVASQHLAILRKAGIVVTEREGKFIFYTINPARIAAINRYSKDILN